MASGIRKVTIGALSPDINNSLVIGVIIAKQTLRLFTSRRDGEERGVWNFTLRDSPLDTINVTFWGTAEGTRKAYENFKTGEVVGIMNARVSFKQPSSSDIAFNPSVSSPFQLQLQENGSSVQVYEEDDAEKIRNLMFIPTKPPGDFLRLSDLLSYGQAMKGDNVNLLVAIRNIGEVRCVKSRRDSRDIFCRDVLVMDQSYLEFPITLWTEDIIERAGSWRPQHTVIFCADVKVDWCGYRQSVRVLITSRTIITENPKTVEAQVLKEYAEVFPVQPIAVLDHFTKTVSDPFAINTLMTTAQIVERAWSNNNVPGNKFTALLYGVITSLDLDNFETPVIYKCSLCSQFMDDAGRCLNRGCLLESNSQYTTPVPIYDLKVNLSDHRGSLLNCRLMTPAADAILNCPVQNYLKMTSEQRTELKWQLLLSRCEVRLLILCTSAERPFPLYSVLTCKKANPVDVSSKLPIY